MTRDEIKEYIKNKRILSIDFGLKRIGLALCDPMHIVVSPFKVIENNEERIENIKVVIFREAANAVVLGYPYRLDDQETEVILEIEKFKKELELAINLKIFLQDESYSSVSAKSIQLNNGTKKKKRRDKSEKDKIAAAVILQDFLREYENY